MRVLLTLASSSVTGPAERMLGDARVLREAGHEVTIALDTRRPGNLGAACHALELPIADEIKLSRISGPWESWRDVVALRRRLVGGVDLVHTHFSHDHHLALLAARGLRARARIVRSLESEASGSRWALRRTDGIEVPSEPLAQSLRCRGGSGERSPSCQVRSIRRGSVAEERPSSVARPTWGRGPGMSHLSGSSPGLGPERRHGELIEAFARVVEREPRARLAIIGRGEGLPALEQQAAKLGLKERCLFAGYWAGDDLVAAYRGLDVAVWLANGNEIGGARSVLEAMAIGVPVVAYATPPMDRAARRMVARCWSPPVTSSMLAVGPCQSWFRTLQRGRRSEGAPGNGCWTGMSGDSAAQLSSSSTRARVDVSPPAELRIAAVPCPALPSMNASWFAPPVEHGWDSPRGATQSHAAVAEGSIQSGRGSRSYWSRRRALRTWPRGGIACSRWAWPARRAATTGAGAVRWATTAVLGGDLAPETVLAAVCEQLQ